MPTQALGTFVRRVLVLLSGQSLAQLIAFAASPLLTRLYTPEDFGVLREILAWSGVFAGMAALRFDMAIPLPRGERAAASLVRLCHFVVGVIAVLSILAAVTGKLLNLAHFPHLYWVLAVGAVVWLTGSFNVGRWWSVRHGRFSTIARASVFGAVVSALFKATGGALYDGPSLLVLGHLAGMVASWFWMRNSMRHDERIAELGSAQFRWTHGFAARCYREFPFYHAPMTLANNFAQQLPVLVMAALFTQAAVGHWALAVMLCQMPIQMLATVVSQVFVKRAADQLRARRSVLRDLAIVTAIMALMAAVYAIVVWFLAEPLIPIFLGEGWFLAARFTKLMLPWTVLIIVAAPSAGLIAPLRLQRGVLVVQVANALVIGASAYLFNFRDAQQLVLFFSVSMAVASLLVVLLAFRYASVHSRSFSKVSG